MPSAVKIRFGWLKAMYIVTLIVAGGSGIGMLISPDMAFLLFAETGSPLLSGIVGSIFLAFAFLAFLGLRDPLRFVSILLMQLIYKTVWLVAVILPLFMDGEIAADIIPTIAVFLVVIVGDLIAVPFSYCFAKTSCKK